MPLPSTLQSLFAAGTLIPLLLVASLTLVIALLLAATLLPSQLGAGNRATLGQAFFSFYVRLGRLRNLLCSACDRAASRYPVANSCQVPFFKSLSDVYTFVFGYKPAGLFVEIGAYDGESFSNTSGLADMGWEGHYLEPIPQYAAAAAARHAGSAPRVRVHTVAVGERDGEVLNFSAAGPFTSSSKEEIESVAASGLHKTLGAMGWSHGGGSPLIPATTVALNTFFEKQGFSPGGVDVMVRPQPADLFFFFACDMLPLRGRPPPVFFTFPLSHPLPRRCSTWRAMRHPFFAPLISQSGRQSL